MVKAILTAGVMAGIMAASAVATSATALPVPKSVSTINADGLVLVRGDRGGGGGGGGGGAAMRSSSGGGVSGARSFSGGRAAVRSAPSHVVRSFSGGHSGGGIKHHRPSGSHGIKHRRGGGFVYYGAPAYYGYSNYYAADECAWLYRKAIRTNSRHWWNQYYECRDDHDD